MKRFASHYVYIPSFGFLKQYVVEINDEGNVVAIYRLEEEIESTIWTPGVIRLMPHDYPLEQALVFDKSEIKTELPDEYKSNKVEVLKLAAIRLYPFNFSEMKTTADTVIQLLDNSIF